MTSPSRSPAMARRSRRSMPRPSPWTPTRWWGWSASPGAASPPSPAPVVALLSEAGGQVLFDGRAVSQLKGQELRGYRRQVQYVFQDPFSSLSPRLAVGKAVAEALDIHGIGKPASRPARVRELLELVGLPSAFADRMPHALSGGQRQRVAIARALAVEPRMLICDEPVSALDVSIRAQIMNLFLDLQRKFGLGLLFIGHDLGLIRRISDRVAVMYLGRVVERGTAAQVFDDPHHPYTRALLAATPSTNPQGGTRPEARPAQWRAAQPEQRPLGLPVPHPLPHGPDCLQHPPAAGAPGRRPARGLPPRQPGGLARAGDCAGRDRQAGRARAGQGHARLPVDCAAPARWAARPGGRRPAGAPAPPRRAGSPPRSPDIGVYAAQGGQASGCTGRRRRCCRTRPRSRRRAPAPSAAPGAG